MFCPVPYCGKPMRRPRMGMCNHCQKVFYKSTVPHAGFIPVTTLRSIARSILKTHGVSKSDIEMALRVARGTRHRQGPWNERPPYRLTPLLTGSPDKRRPQLLVGRRTEPSMEACVTGLVHEVLLEEVLETGSKYAHTLAGMTYFGTRGLYAAPGDKPDKGPAKHSIYRLNHSDFKIVATQVIKACRMIGLEIRSSDLRGQIVSMYLQGQEAGIYRDPIYPPQLAMRTTQVGDHPLDFRLPRNESLDAGTMEFGEAQTYDTIMAQTAMAGLDVEDALNTLDELNAGTKNQLDVGSEDVSMLKDAERRVTEAATQSAMAELGKEGFEAIRQAAMVDTEVNEAIRGYAIQRATGKTGGATWADLAADIKAHLGR